MAWAVRHHPVFPSPLIKPDVRISRIRLSDWFHLATGGGVPMCIGAAGARPAVQRPPGPRTAVCLALARCGVASGIHEPRRRHGCPPPGRPSAACRSRSRSPSHAADGSAGCTHHPMVRRCRGSESPVHDFTFEACSGFTRVTACRIARPPKGGLCHEASAARLPDQAARQLPDPTDNFLDGYFLHW